MENFMLWCRGKVDEFVPAIIGFAITKLLQGEGVQGKQLRVMCMNMVISAMYYNPELTIHTIESVPLGAGEEPLISRFMALWFSQIEDFTGLHSRKLSIYALCQLVQQSYARMPPHLQQVWPHTLPVLLNLFSKLPRAYELQAEADLLDSDEEDLDDEYGEEDYDSDGGLPDELDAGGATEADDLFDKLRDAAVDEDDEDTEELDVNQYGEMRTPLDNADQEEYGLLATLLQDLPGADQQSAEALFSGVQPAHQEQVAHIQQLAQAKAAEKQARAVKAAGGFNFEGCTVPTSFQFSP